MLGHLPLSLRTSDEFAEYFSQFLCLKLYIPSVPDKTAWRSKNRQGNRLNDILITILPFAPPLTGLKG